MSMMDLDPYTVLAVVLAVVWLADWLVERWNG
jgi:hypothetical protein